MSLREEVWTSVDTSLWVQIALIAVNVFMAIAVLWQACATTRSVKQSGRQLLEMRKQLAMARMPHVTVRARRQSSSGGKHVFTLRVVNVGTAAAVNPVFELDSPGAGWVLRQPDSVSIRPGEEQMRDVTGALIIASSTKETRVMRIRYADWLGIPWVTEFQCEYAPSGRQGLPELVLTETAWYCCEPGIETFRKLVATGGTQALG